MNVRVFLKRLAIVLSVPPVLMLIAAPFSKGVGGPEFLLGMGAIWLVVVWACYWIICGLFVPKN